MGTKTKFWWQGDVTQQFWLFKYNRPNTGEDWSEKIASEVAGLIGIPHATVDLAECEGQPGVISLDFTEGKSRGELVHGNELLFATVPRYPKEQLRRVSQHSIPNVLRVLQPFIHVPGEVGDIQGVEQAKDVFVGYLMLDALIGNTDRHHENWGVLARREGEARQLHAELAPSFDHASCLGRNLSPETHRERLDTSDRGFTVQAYADKADSALHRSADALKPLPVLDAFTEFSRHCRSAADSWLDRLAGVDNDAMYEVVLAVPDERMAAASRDFVFEMLQYNRRRLLGLS